MAKFFLKIAFNCVYLAMVKFLKKFPYPHRNPDRNPNSNKLCAWRHNMPPPLLSLSARRSVSRRRADRNIAIRCYSQYVPTLTAAAVWRLNTAVSKAAWWPWPLTLKVVFESRVTWATYVSILVFLGLSVLDLGPTYATDRRQTDVRRQTDRCQTQTDKCQTSDVRQKHRLMSPPIRIGGIISRCYSHSPPRKKSSKFFDNWLSCP